LRCLSCNAELNAFEQRRKYKEHLEIVNPEERYIGLCDGCFFGGELHDLEIEQTFLEDG
jgi:hypothetical protein